MYRYTAEILIAIAAEKEASDVHLIAGLPPKCRIDGQIRSLTDCLKGRKYFPQTMIDMCAVGEETGELEDTLENVADYYTNEADFRIQRLLAMLEPTLLILLSIFAGFIVVSIYLPIFTMYDLM